MASTIDPLIRIKPSKDLEALIQCILLDVEEEDAANIPENIQHFKQSDRKTKDSHNKDECHVMLTVHDIKWVFDHQKVLKNDTEQVLAVHRGTAPQSNGRQTQLSGKPHFHEIIESCEIILPEPKFPPRNPELEARCQKLKAEQQEREYRRMTKNITGGLAKGQDNDESFAEQMKELNNYLLIVFQLVVSVACSFTFGYLAPYYLTNVQDVGPRLMSGIIVAFAILQQRKPRRNRIPPQWRMMAGCGAP